MARISFPQRVPILYLIIGVLVLVSVVPMYFYARQVVGINRDRLKTNEMLLQNTITRALSDGIAQRMANLDSMLGNLTSAIQVTSGGDIGANKINAPELRALLERFVSSSNDLAYATILNSEAKGQSVGRITPDEFLQNEMMRAFNATREGRAYTGQAISIGSGANRKTMIVAAVVLSEAITIASIIGGAVIILGVYLVNRTK